MTRKVEQFETIDGPRLRISRYLSNVTLQRAMQEFDIAKDALK